VGDRSDWIGVGLWFFPSAKFGDAMRTADKILQICKTPKTSTEIAEYCNVKLSSIYSPIGRLQVQKLIKKIGTDPIKFVVSVPVFDVPEENLMITHAHNPFGIRT
jgi:aspartyl-tRNA synthetase